MKKHPALILLALLVLATAASCGAGSAGGAPSAPPAGDGLETLQVPGFGTKSVDPGYLPDPYMVEMAAGGDVDVASLGLGDECTGYTTAKPAFRLVLTEEFDHLSLFFVAGDGSDTALIVNGAEGEWICNDDSTLGGVDPFIEFADGTASGDYEIWIGVASATGTITGTFHFTELDYHPGHMPWIH